MGSVALSRRWRVGWVFLEIALALAIAVGIVWWTLPRKEKPREAVPPDEEKR